MAALKTLPSPAALTGARNVALLPSSPFSLPSEDGSKTPISDVNTDFARKIPDPPPPNIFRWIIRIQTHRPPRLMLEGGCLCNYGYKDQQRQSRRASEAD